MATAKKTPPTAKPMATATPTAVPGDPAPGMRQVLQVISKRDGFRRAGRTSRSAANPCWSPS